LDLPRAADLPAAGQKLKISYPPTVSGILWSKKIDAPSLGIDFATGKSGHITLNGQRFDLISLRVHIPSEHIIEGREFAGELQLEHRSKAGKIAIISTFFDFGEPKPDFILQLKKLNDTPGRPASHFEPMQFIPSSQNHYVYNGSLTNPPCTEGVNWLIFPKPLPIDTRTLGYLRELLGGHANARRHYSLPPPYVPLRNANHALSFESR
jgi:carbonic anhydrase